MRSYYSRCAGILSVKILSYYCFDEFGPRFHDFVHFDSLCLCRRVAFLLHKPQNFSYRLKIRTNKNPIVILKWEDCCDWSSVFPEWELRENSSERVNFVRFRYEPSTKSVHRTQQNERGRTDSLPSQQGKHSIKLLWFTSKNIHCLQYWFSCNQILR